MYKFVLFDLDGTLTDPKEGICKSTQYALHKMGIEEDWEKLTTFIGPPLSDSFMRYYNMDEDEAKKAIEYYRERFSVVGLYENIPYNGIDMVLQRMRDAGLKLAIASSKPHVFIHKILEHFNLDGYFDIVEGSELDGSHVQKADVVRDAVLRCYFGDEYKNNELPDKEVLKQDVIMVGDRCYDVEGAHKFGIPCIGVTYGYALKGELKKSGADKIAHTVEDIAKIVLGDDIETKNVLNKKNGIENNKVNNNANSKGNKGSFFKTVYVLVPFALFYLVSTASVVIGKIIFDELMKCSWSFSKYLVNNETLYSAFITGMANLIAGLAMIATYIRTDEIKVKMKANIGLGALLGGALAIALNLMTVYFFMIFPNLNNTAPKTAGSVPILIGIVIHGFIVPIAEELLFRYMIFGRIKKTMGVGFAIVLSALFFGLYHGNITQCIYAFIMGIVLAYIYYISDNFLMPVAFHIMANITVLLFRYIPVDITKQSYGGVICATAFLLAIVLFRALYRVTKKEVN